MRAHHLAACCAAVLLSAPLAAQLTVAPAPPVSPAALPAPDAHTRLLVVSPHPDDETLCCAGLMQRVLAAGGTVSVLWLTNGDGERGTLALHGAVLGGSGAALRLGAQRMAEARAAATLLGVPAAGQLFLGYPDGGLLQLLQQAAAAPYRSPTTGASAVPYAAALFPGQPYSGAQLQRDFAAVLARVQPTLLLAPSITDQHPDHRAAGLLASAAVLAAPAQRLYWVVHGGEGWPAPRQLMPGIPLFPGPAARGLASGAFALSVPEEERKQQALAAHRSQMQVMAPFLLAFVRSNELYAARAAP